MINNLNELISYLFLIGVIIGLVIAIIVMVRHRRPKKHHIISGIVTANHIRNAGKIIDTTIRIVAGDGDFDYRFTREFIVNKPNLYVKYYDDYKSMKSHGQIDEFGVLLTDLDRLNYKFYVIFDVLPNKPGSLVYGYIEDSHFYVTGTVD